MVESDIATSSANEYPNYVFYPYSGDEQYGFWVELNDDTAVSLFERTPENGMWLDPTPDSGDYAKEEPTDDLKEIMALLVTEQMVDMNEYDIPDYEDHFVDTIYTTAAKLGRDNIPQLVWDFMHDCADELGMDNGD
jgi:hypothetical protein